MDNLENKMKHTKVEGVIPRLFEGKMIVSFFLLICSAVIIFLLIILI
jgi:hypothetical protein